ncbi:acyltransferase [Vibrio sp. TH_r3]|uniref:acyltransferase family protein n=1 Tax=Vibrio sp. TH_r3 TaxID=3082084 RepID=UPI0029555E30|nr:acyltransferase [Vibrio sp. TH_r3]MDV7102876.1 acyltransferase [Vibrio sp. TH_r3]
MDNRNLKIDTLRGIACLLLVAYHVIGSSPGNGLKISEGFYRDINDTLAYIRMPLFTFLSGFVYAYRPFSKNIPLFLSKKVRRLIIPMFTVGTIFAVLQMLVPGSNTSIDNWYLLHIKPVAHFWFVESLFLVFILIVFLESLKLLDGFFKCALVIFFMSIIYCSPIGGEYFSFSGFFYLAPFFLLGMSIERYDLLKKIPVKVKLLVVILSITLLACVYFGLIPMYGNRTLFALVLGAVSCCSMLFSELKVSLFARIGAYSYSIYLFHVFFTAGSRIFLFNFNIYNTELVFVLSLFLGVLGPMVTEVILCRFNSTRVFFLGKAPKRIKSNVSSVYFFK